MYMHIRHKKYDLVSPNFLVSENNLSFVFKVANNVGFRKHG